MKKLIIIGAGGFGRETLQWALSTGDYGKNYLISGFLDDNLSALENHDLEYKIIGKIKDWVPKSDELFVDALGSPKTKKLINNLLAEKGAVFTNIIHSSVIIASTAKIGVGNVICPNVVISDSAVINNHITINIGSTIGHDTKIGSFSTISSLCDLTGGVIVGEGVFIGSKVSVVPGRHIGMNSYLCAGSVIMSNVKTGFKMLGNPAKKFDIHSK